MSVVTGVLLAFSSSERFVESADAADRFPLVDSINAWLAAREFPPLADLTDYFGGNKHPQMTAFGGGYNYLPHDEFRAFVLSLSWEFPESVVLITNYEHDRAFVVERALNAKQ
jgi:hypothetical protein